jgi:FSR family fosmidomycin resistance protein-like MFS transporter
MRRRDKLTLAALCAGHFVNDSYSSIIYPLLPLIKIKLGLTAAQIFWLAPLYAISSSLMQPVYGFISDRYFRRFFAVFGPAITGIRFDDRTRAVQWDPDRVAGSRRNRHRFVPPTRRCDNTARKRAPAVGMALFSAVGTLGFAVGPR